jgi:hypothetical protein
MNFILQRFSDNKVSTTDLMFEKASDGQHLKFECFALEDEYREVKVKAETRIPEGFYEIVIRQEVTEKTKEYQNRYDWFKKHLEIKNVPGFTGIYIHIGNTDKDTEGCILLGDTCTNNQVDNGFIGNSTVAFKRFYLKVFPHLESGGKAFIEIRNENRMI